MRAGNNSGPAGRTDLDSIRLPRDFLFGVSSSGYQTEGGFNREGEPHNNWAEWERTGKVELSGDTTSFWDLYCGHISRAASIGMNAFRMGIEWARIQPSFTRRPVPAPPWDPSALDDYAFIIDRIMSADIEPIITLHHFTHPAWLGKDLWLDSGKASLWAGFAVRAVKEINTRLIENGKQPIKYWVTINEPNILPLATYVTGEMPHGGRGLSRARRATDNLMLAHVLAYDGIHSLYEREGWGTPLVSFNNFCTSIYEFDRAFYDLMRAPSLGVKREELKEYLLAMKVYWNRSFLDLARRRWGGESLYARSFVGCRAVSGWLFDTLRYEEAIEAVYASERLSKVDFLALDIYDPFVVGGACFKFPALEKSREKASIFHQEGPVLHPPCWEWHHDAEHFGTVILAHNHGGLDLPIYIMENGLAHRQKGQEALPRRDGMTREEYLRSSIRETVKCMLEGVPVKGYVYRSLTDSYEWGSYQPRFGLYEYDYRNGRIMDTDGLGQDSGRIYGRIVGAVRSGSPGRIYKELGA